MTAIGLAPVAAMFVSAAWRASWNGRTCSVIPAAFSAARNSPAYHSCSSLEPRVGWAKTKSVPARYGLAW